MSRSMIVAISSAASGGKRRFPTSVARVGSARSALWALTIARTVAAILSGSRLINASVVTRPAKVKFRAEDGPSPRRTSSKTFPYATPYCNLGCHGVGPEGINLACLKCLGCGHTKRDTGFPGTWNRHDLHFVTLSVESGCYQQLLERHVWSLICANPQPPQCIHVSALCAEV